MSGKRSRLDSYSLSRPLTRRREGDLTTEDIDGQFATAVGLTPWSLSEEERTFLPSNLDNNVYLVIRNLILAKWRTNPKVYLKMEGIKRLVKSSHLELAAIAWKFLDHFGYINFGVGEALNRALRLCDEPKGVVIVVGAGLAGLAAARQLKIKGHRVIVLEGRDRIGGRVHSKTVKVNIQSNIPCETCVLAK